MVEGVSHARRLANILHFLSISPLLSSFSFSLLSPLSLPALCQPTKGPQYKRRDTGLRHSTQLLLISLHSEEKNALTCTLTHTATQIQRHTHIHICLDTESHVGSATGVCSQLICNTDHSVRKKENHVKATTVTRLHYLLLFSFYGTKTVSCNSQRAWFVV